MNENDTNSASASGPDNQASEADASFNADTPTSAAVKTPAEREAARLHDADPATAVAEAIRRAGGNSEEPQKASRPPLWLIVFTLAIPLAIGYMWYNSSMIRPLTCDEIAVKLEGSDAAEMRHALQWVGENIDEYSKAQQVEGVTREWKDVQPCVDAVLRFAESPIPNDQLNFDLARALGSFHIVPNTDQKFAAFRWLEDVVDGSHSMSHDKVLKYQAATSLARFGREYLREQGKLGVVQSELVKMLQENSEELTLNGVFAMHMVGSRVHSQELASLARNSPYQSVKQAAYAAARDCAERID